MKDDKNSRQIIEESKLALFRVKVSLKENAEYFIERTSSSHVRREYYDPELIIIRNEFDKNIYNGMIGKFDDWREKVVPLEEIKEYPYYIVEMDHITCGIRFGAWKYFDNLDDLARVIQVKGMPGIDPGEALKAKKRNDLVDNLIEAARKGNLGRVKTLINADVNINARGCKFETALNVAAGNGHIEVVRLLQKNGALTDAGEAIFWEGYIKAVIEGYTEIVELFLAILSYKEKLTEPFVLLKAVEEGHLEIVRLLLDHGADVEGTWLSDRPLYTASRHGHMDVVSALLDNGAKVNLPASNHNTALMAASEGGHTDIVRALIKEGADVNETGFGNRTAMWYAKKNNYPEIIEHLKNAGAKR